MQKKFSELGPLRRLQNLQKMLSVFVNNAKMISAPFSIISYGSSSYGFNPKCHGKIDDIDLFIVIPRKTVFDDFIEAIQMVFLTKVTLNISHFESVLQNENDICRMYGQVSGVKVGFRIICEDVLKIACSKEGCSMPLKNIASIGQSRIINDSEWGFSTRSYIPVIYQSEYKRLGDQDILLVYHYSLSPEVDRLGAFGRKILAGTVIYEAENSSVTSIVSEFWRVFVELSLDFNDKLTTEEIIDSIIRSERFSEKFRVKLTRQIQKFR